MGFFYAGVCTQEFSGSTLCWGEGGNKSRIVETEDGRYSCQHRNESFLLDVFCSRCFSLLSVGKGGGIKMEIRFFREASGPRVNIVLGGGKALEEKL